ncbi:hypothetical protein AWH60_10305 [Pseudoalteromonas haloplanktis]|nr:hypothetical protein AWH60_10305 [Pseudoalteromonas haloplanktis]
MSYVAKFKEIDGDLFRFDTRVYLNGYDANIDGACIAAIIGKNPGSASPTILDSLAPLDLDGDKLLPNVRNRFLSAFKQMGKTPPENSYVQVWNLFYLCNKDLGQAIESYKKHGNAGYCPTESSIPELVWFAWGPSDQYLNNFKGRFLSKELDKRFFYNNRLREVSAFTPKIIDSVKHTQGMPAFPVESHLASVL